MCHPLLVRESMSKEHISHKDLAGFADSHVNLKREAASRYREQVNDLRERLEKRLGDDPNFQLKKNVAIRQFGKRYRAKKPQRY